MMSSEASKYSVESWPVTSIEEKEKREERETGRGRERERGRQEGDAVACEMQRAASAHGAPIELP